MDDAKADLKWIRTMTAHDVDDLPDENQRYKRSPSGLEDLLATFNVVNYYAEEGIPELTNEAENGDAWYSNFRSKECKNGDCTHKTIKYKKKAKKKRKHRKAKTKKLAKAENDTPDDNAENEFEERLEKKKFKLGKTDPDYEDYDNDKNFPIKNSLYQKNNRNNIKSEHSRNMNYESQDTGNSFINDNNREFEKQSIDQAQEINYDGALFDSFQKPSDDSQPEPIELKDQLEKTQNDLSHEADYKLSKIEQEAMDKKSRPLKHPEYQIPMLMQRKVPDESIADRSKTAEYRETSKRSVNPINEVKLKVSERLMLKGLGASLPSDAIDEDRIHYNIPNDLESNNRNTIEKFREALWSRSTDNQKSDANLKKLQRDSNSKKQTAAENERPTGRKLMAIDDYDLIEDFDHQETKFDKSKLQEPISDVSQRELNGKLNHGDLPLSSDYNLKYNNFAKEKRSLNQPQSKKDPKGSKKISEDDDTLTLDFDEEFLKGPDIAICGDPTKLVKAGSKLNSSAVPENSTTPKSSEAFGAANLPNTKSNNTQSKGNTGPLTFKLSIAFNATVLNDTQSKLPHPLLKSGCSDQKLASKKRNDYPKDDSTDEITVEKRGIIFPPLPSEISKRTNEAVKKSIAKSTQESPLDCLMSGKLSAQLVNAVFRLVENNDNFRGYILPGLKKRRLKACTGCNNLAAMKNEKNCDQIDRSEKMLREVMDTISAIIEQQVRTRTCIPLCAKLKEFYDLIIASRTENERMARATRMRRIHHRAAQLHRISKRNIFTEPVIRRKYSVVKKLLDQYGYLPAEDQEKNKDIRDMLQMHLTYLNELEQLERKRRKREFVAKSFLNQDNNVKSRETEFDEISPKFAKLVRVADLIRKSSVLAGDTDYPSLQDYD